MQQQNNESTSTSVSHDSIQPARKRYHPPTLRAYGPVRSLTLTNNPGGGSIDDGSGSPIYTS